MTKKLFTLLLAVAASVGTMFAMDYKHVQIGDLYYNLDTTNKTAEVTYEEAWNDNYSGLTTATIPSSVIYNEVEYSVTSIGNDAFYLCSGLTSVTIPNTVTSIGWSAFSGCSGLTSVTIPNSVTSIVLEAFRGCSGLTSITIPYSVTSIGNYVFKNCTGLTSIIVENGNTVYDSRNNCNAIIETATNTLIAGCKNSIIPNSVTSIGGYAFSGCSGLTSVTIPNSVSSIGSDAFSGCSGLTSIIVENGNTVYDSRNNCNAIIEKATNTLIAGCKNTIIPNSVTSIGYSAFYSCKSLTSVTIPNSVTSIGNNAFSGCSGLTSVTIPNSVTNIGFNAFWYCSGLTSVTIPNSVTSIGDYAFFGCSGLTSVTNYATTPQTITSNVFGGNIFYPGVNKSACTLYVPAGSADAYKAADVWKEFGKIETLDETPSPCITASGACGENVTWSLSCDNVLTISGTGTMANYSYEKSAPWVANSDAIKSVIIGEGVTSIGNLAFQNCTGLTSVTIPNSVTSIREEAFRDCSGLSSVTIPNSVTSIGDGAFFGCTGLTSIIVENGNTSFDSRDNCNAIIETATNTLIQGCKNTTIPNSVTSIGDMAFTYCTGLSSIKIPNNVTSIGYGAFFGCTGLTSVTIPNSVTSIGDYAFACCFRLTSVTIPNSVTSIGDYAFSNCTGLTSVTNYATTPQGNSSNVFNSVNKSTCTLYVPAGSVDTYKAAEGWKDFENIVGVDVPGEDPTSAPAVYTNPANLAQKLIKNGNVYILTEDKTYTITGQQVK